MKAHPRVVIALLYAVLALTSAIGHAQVTTVLTVSNPSYSVGVPLQLRAQSDQGIGVVAGMENFYDGLHFLGSAQVIPTPGTSSGKATLSVLLPPGPHALSAQFTGSSVAGPSSSPVVTIDVGGLLRPFMSLEPSIVGKYSVQIIGTGSKPEGGALSLKDTSNTSLGSTVLDAAKARLGLVGGPQSSAPNAGAAITADVDGDGRPDMIVASATDGTVTSYLGTAIPGAFTQGSTVDVGTTISDLVAADFNCDGTLDLAVITGYSGTLQVLLGDPNRPGVFLNSGSSVVIPPAPTALISADFNRDGLPDLAVASSLGNSVSILLNNPSDTGHFLEVQTVQVGHVPVSLATGDLRQLGVLDIAVANYADGSVSILQNDLENPGSFSSTPSIWKADDGVEKIIIGDMDGDGIPDLVTCNSLANTISVFPGQRISLGSFPTQRLTSATGCSSLLAIDYDGDGLMDILALDRDASSATVFLNSGYGLLQSANTLSLGPQPQTIIAANFTGSGRNELLVVDGSAQTLQLFEQGWILNTDLKPSGIPQNELTVTYSPNAGSEYDTSSATIAVPAADSIVAQTGKLKTQTISLRLPSALTYGDAPVAVSATSTSGLPVSLSIESGQASLQSGVLAPNGVGPVVVRAYQSGNDVYAQSVQEQTITIAPKALIVTPSSSERNLGDENPAFNGTVAGLVAGDELQVAYTSAANTSTPAGTYSSLPFAIVPTLIDKGGRLRNYAVTANLGALSIVPRQVTIGSPIEHGPSGPIGVVPPKPVKPRPPFEGSLPIGPVEPPSPVTPVPIEIGTPVESGDPISRPIGTSPGAPVSVEPPRKKGDPGFTPNPPIVPQPGLPIPAPPTQVANPKSPEAPPTAPVAPIPHPGPSPVPIEAAPSSPILSVPRPIGRQPIQVTKPAPPPPAQSGGSVRVSVHISTEILPSLLNLSAEVIGLARDTARTLKAVSGLSSMPNSRSKIPTAAAAAAEQLSTSDGIVVAIAASVMTPNGPATEGNVVLEREGHEIDSRVLDSRGSVIFTIPAAALHTGSLSVRFSGTHNLKSSKSNPIAVPNGNSGVANTVSAEGNEYDPEASAEREEYSCP